MAVRAALDAKTEWYDPSWMRKSCQIMIKAAALISQKHRFLFKCCHYAPVRGKNVHQAEIDSACEVIDYLRFNSHFASLIYRCRPVLG